MSSFSGTTTWSAVNDVFQAPGRSDLHQQIHRRICADFPHDQQIRDSNGFRRLLCELLEGEPPLSGSRPAETEHQTPQISESLCHLPQVLKCRGDNTKVWKCPGHHVNVTQFIPLHHNVTERPRHHAQVPTCTCLCHHPTKFRQYPRRHLKLPQNMRYHPEILNHPCGDASFVFSTRALSVLEA